MSYFLIEGNNKLSGKVEISGSKNSALPILASTILISDNVELTNVPDLLDVKFMCKALEILGAKVRKISKNKLIINSSTINQTTMPPELMNKMRASIYVMGPLLAKYGEAKIAMPGGCAIGRRPINIHLEGFSSLGVKLTSSYGFITAKCKNIKSNSIFLDYPSVGATANLIMASVISNGTITIYNPAKEPHIKDLVNFLNLAGANISGVGTEAIKIEGVDKINSCSYTLMPDPIEAGTFITASAITKSNITLANIKLDTLFPITTKLEQSGIKFIEEGNSIKVISPKKTNPIQITTFPYPGYPTDMQPQTMALLSLADGTSIIKETVFENRFMHVDELRKMSADIHCEGNTCIIKGKESLYGAEVYATDIRAGAGLIIAALGAHGISKVHRVEHIERGYENIEEKLTNLGAIIKKLDED